MSQWTLEQEETLLLGMQRRKSNQWIADCTGKTIAAVKRRKHLFRNTGLDSNDNLPPDALVEMNKRAVAAMLTHHPERECRFR